MLARMPETAHALALKIKALILDEQLQNASKLRMIADAHRDYEVTRLKEMSKCKAYLVMFLDTTTMHVVGAGIFSEASPSTDSRKRWPITLFEVEGDDFSHAFDKMVAYLNQLHCVHKWIRPFVKIKPG